MGRSLTRRPRFTDSTHQVSLWCQPWSTRAPGLGNRLIITALGDPDRGGQPATRSTKSGGLRSAPFRRRVATGGGVAAADTAPGLRCCARVFDDVRGVWQSGDVGGVGARSKAPRRAPRASHLKTAWAYEDGQNPAHVYLSGMSGESARVMGCALASIADILSDGALSAENLAWHRIRSEHVSKARPGSARLPLTGATSRVRPIVSQSTPLCQRS
jgi:hypothetical protein